MMTTLAALLALSGGTVAATARPTPEWRAAGTLLLRSDPQRADGLLLAHSARPVVYRYLPEQRDFTAVDRKEWDAAGAQVADCSAPADPDSRRLRIEPRSGQLLAGERPVKLAGAIAVRLARSPSGAWIAALSAKGPRKGALFPSLAGAGASGSHYHEVLGAPDNVPAGPAVEIPLDSGQTVVLSCWSSDESYLVYHDYLFTQAVVVPFAKSEKER
jgi:hypothetical protein